MRLRYPVCALVAGTGFTIASAGASAVDLQAAKGPPPQGVDGPLSKLDPGRLATCDSNLKSLSFGQLFRSYSVYLACGSSLLVNIAPTIVDTLESMRDNVPLIGPLVWHPFIFLMRHTFFQQFVAGETAAEADPVLHALRERSCGALLNWSAEATHHKDGKNHRGVLPEAVTELTNALHAISRFQPQGEPISTILAVKSECGWQ